MFLRLGVLCLPVAIASFADRPSSASIAPRRGDVFTVSDRCAVCHLASPRATAMRSATGDDVSPAGLWRGTMMANAFHDPYFRAQLAKETAAAGPEVQELCLRCHAPMAHHEAVLVGNKPPRLADIVSDPLANDGVSCTVCHMIDGQNLGRDESFSGRPSFNRERKIFGPFADVATGPMRNMVRYTPTQGAHVRTSALCGSCHTLITEHQGTPFPEQTPYLEWRNSVFSDEGEHGAEARTCQQCHMPAIGATRIARNPMGLDFLIPPREGYAAHAFVGGNAFMLDLLRTHRDELGVTAAPEALSRMAFATRRQLAEGTLRLEISPIELAGGTAKFTVKTENLAGHKFPTGYPARRAWLHVRVAVGGKTVFESGAPDAQGRIAGVADEHALPHRSVIDAPDQVLVWEVVATDPEGAPTTMLTRMVKKAKDTRLLPRGWKADGPHAAETAPVGVDGDADFVGGSDTVAFAVPMPGESDGPVQVIARVHYQTIPPAWVDALRGVDDEAAKRFVGMYDAADRSPETVAVAVRVAR